MIIGVLPGEFRFPAEMPDRNAEILLPFPAKWDLPYCTLISRLKPNSYVTTALKLVGLTDRADHYPRQLSGGQEQRVAIARAIVTDPTFILADEPTGDLDAESAVEVMEVLQGLNRQFNKTILLVTHDPRAASFAKVRHYLDKGILVEKAVGP